MKVAFIVSTFPSLSETFILNQITGLIDRGHDVDIYANSPGANSVVHEDINQYDLMRFTTYFFSDKAGEKRLTDRLYRKIRAVGYPAFKFSRSPKSFIEILSMRNLGQEETKLSLLNKTARALNRGKYDIVHCHFGKNGILGAILKDMGVIEGKIITTFHGADMSRYVERKGRNVYDYLFEKGDLFLPISNYWRKKLLELGCNERKIIVHRMGIDTNKFRYSPRNLRKNKKIRMLTIARLVEKKGVQYSIQAVVKILKKYPNIEYRIIGDGPLSDELAALIEKSNAGNSIKLIGHRQQDEVIELMKDSDILLAPSVTGKDGDKEGIPVVLMEALAQGMPVISTYHSGIPELVLDGKSGFLVPEKNVNILADKLTYLIEHPDKWTEIGRIGRKHIEENYIVDKLNDRLVEIYYQLTNREN